MTKYLDMTITVLCAKTGLISKNQIRPVQMVPVWYLCASMQEHWRWSRVSLWYLSVVLSIIQLKRTPLNPHWLEWRRARSFIDVIVFNWCRRRHWTRPLVSRTWHKTFDMVSCDNPIILNAHSQIHLGFYVKCLCNTKILTINTNDANSNNF